MSPLPNPLTAGATQSTRPGIAVPAAVLCVLALSFPTTVSRAAGGGADERCVTVAERGPGDAPAPLALLEECSARFPKNPELAADLGAAYEPTAPARAETEYRRALQLDDDFADVRLRLGELLYRRGATGEARLQAERGLAVQPNRRALLDLAERTQTSSHGQP